jgi:uncharacterized protein
MESETTPQKNKPLIAGRDIRIDREGMWFYRGVEMIRREIVRLFYQNLIQDTSGRYFIEIGPQRCAVEVEDTAFVVWSIRYSDGNENAGESIYLILSDDSIEKLNPETLRIGENDIPYCSVRDGRFKARFSKSGYYQLAEHIDYDPIHDRFSLSLNKQSHYL